MGDQPYTYVLYGSSPIDLASLWELTHILTFSTGPHPETNLLYGSSSLDLPSLWELTQILTFSMGASRKYPDDPPWETLLLRLSRPISTPLLTAVQGTYGDTCTTPDSCPGHLRGYLHHSWQLSRAPTGVPAPLLTLDRVPAGVPALLLTLDRVPAGVPADSWQLSCHGDTKKKKNHSHLCDTSLNYRWGHHPTPVKLWGVTKPGSQCITLTNGSQHRKSPK